jgi:hypothetical protein
MGRRGWLLRWIVGGLSMPLGCGGLDERAPAVLPPAASESSEPGSAQSDDGAEPSGSAMGAASAMDAAAMGAAPTPSDAPEPETGDEGDGAATSPGEGTDSGMAESDSQGTAGALGLASSRLDFGVIGLGQSQERLVEIANRSTDSIAVSAAVQAPSGGVAGFELGPGCNERLSPAATCELPVRFSPGAVGRWENVLLLVTDRDETASIELVGEVRTPPRLVSNESSFTFEPLPVGMAAVHRWVVTNDGGVRTNAIIVRLFFDLNDTVDFGLAYDCAEGLEPGASCNIDITFGPTRPSQQSARVNLSTASGIPGVGPLEIDFGVRGEGL